VPRFYFRQYVNGQWMAKDRRGREFASPAEACTYGIRRAPALLRRFLRPKVNTYLSTEISDGKRTLFIIRGKVISEKA
jgi:hypothetical protein